MPIGPLDGKDEQSEEERLEIARRYRRQRDSELRELAAAGLGAGPEVIEEVGEFSTLPLESLAAVPLLGAFFAFAARARRSRKRVAPNVLLALDAEQLHLLSVRPEIKGPRAELVSSWPRSSVRIRSVEPRFMREQVVLEIADEEPLKLFAAPLRTNPWAAALVRGLGGDAPQPLDLGD